MLEREGSFENRPAYIDIGVENEGRSLIVKSHENVTKIVNDSLKTQTLTIESSSTKYDYQSLPIIDQWPWWGYGPVFDRIPSRRKSWDYWECPLPVIVSYPPIEIPDDLSDYLDGNELDPLQYQWKHSLGISATLGLLFRTAQYHSKPTDAIFPQLMDLSVRTEIRERGGSLAATLGEPMNPWLSMQQNSVNQPATLTMKNAYEHMTGGDSGAEFRRYGVFLRNGGGIHLSCPGNACGLDPELGPSGRSEGKNLLPHNVDTVIQQLTLLMGLASIHDQVRQYGIYE